MPQVGDFLSMQGESLVYARGISLLLVTNELLSGWMGTASDSNGRWMFAMPIYLRDQMEFLLSKICILLLPVNGSNKFSNNLVSI